MDLAAAHANSNGMDHAALIGASLAPDMLPLSGQVQSASDNAKNGVARLTGVDAPRFADNEKTFDELKARIDRTVDFLTTGRPEQFEGAEDREVELKFRSVSGVMSGESYLTNYLLPNFHFHVATAHAIMRHVGVDIGKKDYLGPFD